MRLQRRVRLLLARLELLVEPLQYVFIRRGLIEALMMGGICGAMGAFVVARGWGFIGDAISHAIFPGVVIAYLGRFNFSLGALAFGVLTAMGIGAGYDVIMILAAYALYEFIIGA